MTLKWVPICNRLFALEHHTAIAARTLDQLVAEQHLP